MEPLDGRGAFGVGRAQEEVAGGAGVAWPGVAGARWSVCTAALSVDIALLEDGPSGVLQTCGVG